MSLKLHPLTLDELKQIGKIYAEIFRELHVIDGQADLTLAPIFDSVLSENSPFSEDEQSLILAGVVHGLLYSNQPYTYHSNCMGVALVFKIIDWEIRVRAELWINRNKAAEKVNKANQMLKDKGLYYDKQ